jgi:hypothetical protein
LSANLSGNICATPDGEVIVFEFTGLVDGFVLKRSHKQMWLICYNEFDCVVHSVNEMSLRKGIFGGFNFCFKVSGKTYLLNDDSFNGSCCLIPDVTFGELAEPTKLTGEGLFAAGEW